MDIHCVMTVVHFFSMCTWHGQCALGFAFPTTMRTIENGRKVLKNLVPPNCGAPGWWDHGGFQNTMLSDNTHCEAHQPFSVTHGSER